MELPIYQVDAFASAPFEGNPAAVCLLEAPSLSDACLSAIAAEMNLSETAFAWPAGGGYGLRWFTPAVEVDLCGHATLATAHVLWESGRADGALVFQTRSGALGAEEEGGLIHLDFPATPAARAEPPPALLSALGIHEGGAVEVRRGRFDYMVVLDEASDVRALAPDFRALRDLDVRGVIVTAMGDEGEGVDFVSRFFAPGAGIDEDPVTGSAHCTLGPYWSERLKLASVVGYQASPRGGTVRVDVRGDRVRLGGRAVTVLEGVLKLDG